jgi:thymidylate synthase (FAD)
MKYIKVSVPDDFDGDTLTIVNPNQDNQTASVWKPQYINVLNHGFVGLVDFYGDDAAVVNAARVSYGAGTKKSRSDRHLIRYLMRNSHSTPFEMVDFKFHIKAPIFVFRQWHRHRTFSINEYSARYSEMKDEMYIPEPENLAPQSTTNKQGREDYEFGMADYNALMSVIDECFQTAYQGYQHLLGPNKNGDITPPTDGVLRRIQWAKDAAVQGALEARRLAKENNDEDPYPTEEHLEGLIASYMAQNGVADISDDFPGIARELSRILLPVATYSEMYWKGNLWNLMHFLKLRADGHAQYEIRVYADAIIDMIRPYIEWSMEAWDDYLRNGTRLSRMETETIRELLKDSETQTPDFISEKLKAKGSSEREIQEFLTKFRNTEI